MESVPIACSLSATDQRTRQAEMAAAGRHLTDSRVTGRNASLRFEPDRTTRHEVEAIVSAEAQCCAFLEFDIQDDADGFELRVSSPAGAESVLADIVAAF